MQLKSPRFVKTLPFILPLIILTVVVFGQDVRIRTRVELVVVPVSVEDANGRPVAGLTEQDFTILEDGKKQDVTNFSIEPVPISAAVLIDTGISPASFEKIKNSFAALAGAFADEDEVAVYRFDRYVTRLMDFSRDRMLIAGTLEKLLTFTPSTSPVVSGPFSSPSPVINGIPVAPGAQPIARPQVPPTKVLNDVVFQATEELASRGDEYRKVVLVISDGENRGSEHDFDLTINRLLDHGVTVYSIGMDAALLSRGRSTLGSYAEQTGGRACFLGSQNELETCLSRVTESARNQYVISYISSNKVTGKKPVFRDIRVKTLSAGLEVRHRKGYFQVP